MISTPRSVRVKFSRADPFGNQVLTGGIFFRNGTGRRNMIGRNGIPDNRQGAGIFNIALFR
jgi:hypothetical protein